jgi:hypothetical protein
MLRHRRLVANGERWEHSGAPPFADTEEVTSPSVAVEHARRWSWPRTVVDEAFVRTPNFTPDGRDRPAQTPVRTAVSRHTTNFFLLDAQPTDGDDANYKIIVVVFSDLSADRARGVFDDVLQQLAVPSYVEDGILFGPFYEGHEGTAIYNSSFRPFQSPVPFLFVRHGVTSDWRFFLDNEDWLVLWARRFGESAVHALAEELRRLPWRVGRD